MNAIAIDPAQLNKELAYLIIYLVISVPVLVLYLWLSRKARKEWLVLMGQLKPKDTYGWERRTYIRLNTMFPVELQRVGGEAQGRLYEGYTRDISKTGMCVELKELHGKPLEDIIPDSTKLKLNINMPIYAEPVEAMGLVKWVQKLESMPMDKYVVGIAYERIREEDASRIIKYALWIYRKPVFITSAIVILVLTVAVLFTFLSDLRSSKRRLEREVQTSYQEKRDLVDRIKKVELEKTDLDSELEDSLQKQKLLAAQPVIVEEEKEPIHEEEILEEEEYFLEEEQSPGEEPLLEDVSQLLELEKEEAEELEDLYSDIEEAIEDDIEPEEVNPGLSPEKAKRIKDEAGVYKKFRDYILKGEIQLLDRYCYQSKSSIYHAAGLFALAEMRYERNYNRDAIEDGYQEVIKRYPQSKYASYASHRINQVKKRSSYGLYTLRYYYMSYGLPPLFDYREIEPYFEE